MMMKAYISSSASVSAQQSFENSFPWSEITVYNERMSAIEPEYKDFIAPLKMRRMNRIVKMGTAAAASCLQSIMLEKPAAIITATGWGCLADTYKFLDELIEKKEESLSPATFIQSTHNTVGGQIALNLDCQEYNSIYVNHTSSFEHGLLDALMLIAEGKDNVLIGGIDEYTEKDYLLKKKAGYWKDVPIKSIQLIRSDSKGTIAGEGASFFLITKSVTPQSVTTIDGVFFGPEESIFNKIKHETNLAPDDFDLIISGYNGDTRIKEYYKQLMHSVFRNKPICYYKNLCGEYDTSSAFALWLADQILKTQSLPDYLLIDEKSRVSGKINRILIHHFVEPDSHACMLVSKAGL